MAKNLPELCRPIELLLSDVDGVLTDGTLQYDNQGIETKRFHIRDGIGVRLWQKCGYRVGLVTARSSQIVKSRAAELGIDIVRQATLDKPGTIAEIVGELEIEPSQVCYLGDDLPDLPVLRMVGLGVAVADACEEVRDAADYVTAAAGGKGALRETVELILKAQHRWEDLIQEYTTR